MFPFVCPNCHQQLDIQKSISECPHCGRALSSHAQATEAIEMNAHTPAPGQITFAARAGSAPPKSNSGTRVVGGKPTAVASSIPKSPQEINFEKTLSWSSDDEPSTMEDSAELTAFLAPPQMSDELGRLGPYRILKVLGQGGMGVVYLAEDQVLKRPVAIKAMLPGVAAKQVNRQRFLREARAMAKIKNEHVITIYQVDDDRGVPYLAMEFLEGEPLDVRLARECRLPYLDIARIGRETADGLASAHENGLIHRDIKPGNLWLVKPRGRVVILDFGLARVAEEDSSLTRSGIILGTPAYMSPEQARTMPLDGRSDLFSLGVVLYRMATGKLPFNGQDAFAVLAALTMEEAKPIWDLNPDVPWPLGKIINQLMAKNPDDRPATAADVAQILYRVEEELRDPASILAPLSKPRSGPLPDVAPLMSLDLENLSIKDDEDALDVGDLEILPDEPLPPAPLVPAKRFKELTGHALGVYEIGPVLGQGQHGVTFRARDGKSGQTVALRILSPEFPRNDEETHHFTQAVGNALALRHPNLVALYGAGKTAPYCWMAQEFIDGRSLAQVLQELEKAPKASWQMGVRVAYHIGQALEFTRLHRIIHGNVTPANILIRASDQTALLNDLRLVKALKGSRLQQSVVDQKVFAERAYLAPEQVDGGKSYVDFLCDLYGLGAVVYHLITGQPLFPSDTLKEAIAEIRDGTPIRPRKIQKAIPRELEFVVMRMLAKRQEDRYQSPTDVLADLRPIVKAHGIKV